MLQKEHGDKRLHKKCRRKCSMSNAMQVPVKDLPHKLQQMLNEANLLAEEVKRKDKSWPAMESILRRVRRREQYAQQGFY